MQPGDNTAAFLRDGADAFLDHEKDERGPKVMAVLAILAAAAYAAASVGSMVVQPRRVQVDDVMRNVASFVSSPAEAGVVVRVPKAPRALDAAGKPPSPLEIYSDLEGGLPDLPGPR